jgi:putative glycosyltransferase (exosortase G-associated)
MYNTDTVCEDTHVTFQIRDVLEQKIALCNDAIFYVDPIESVNRLYTQRQRWQRGEIEVVHMFLKNKVNNLKNVFGNFVTRLVMFDHTFAFPRMIWYFALICLGFMNYPFSLIIKAIIIMYALYVFSTLLLYICVCLFLKKFKRLRRYYERKWYLIFLLPLYNFVVFWFRFAGIINSINRNSTWKTLDLKDERQVFCSIVKKDFGWLFTAINKARNFVNYND